MYNTIQTLSDDHIDDLHLVASDPYRLPYWLEPSLLVLDYLSETFPFDESIHYYISTKNPMVVLSDFQYFPVACTTL